MENMNRCYYDQLVEQIRSQKLDSNVLFGPINCLSQKDFLEVENIKFFITLGLDTWQLSQVWNDGPLNSDNSVVVNFDPNFDYNRVDTETRFLDENAENLHKIAAHVMRAYDDNSTQQHLRSLFNSDITSLSTVYGGSWGVQIRNLLDIAIMFKMASQYGKLLIVSKNGNDNVLVSLLVALQIIQNPHISVLEAFKFIKVQRPSVQELAPEFVSLCSSLGGTPLSGSTPDKQGRKFEQMDYLTSKRSRVSN